MMHKLCKLYNIACILIPEAESYENTMSVLRVVHTQVFSFFKSMSERGGSDLERLRI